ncbi:putative coiled-coil protein SlyX [Pseudomonas marginalis]|uniref:hypothetical protein n=1 Tax=Pseudomonas marginalis TaxID=298 RepID=UPI00209EB415|nr:hypothetical protein [Pseudomonas marginalis]MCP1508267.1 putative coiled-coil protein SlyX [Pseudomonas marginalis]MCP1525771.1 putative coiled-coil protein SlyX [Pseudomonas marginalis]MDQ0498915.1 putative coiled-coil protein SlyX [Pseudomonas marginalis]
MTDQTLEELESKLTEYEMKLPELNSVNNALWKSTSQCQTLLKESGATTKPVKITSIAKRFTPDRPFFIDSIDFHGENAAKMLTSLTVIIKPLGKAQYNLQLSITGQGTKFCYGFIRCFCEWFEIYSDSLLNKPKLTKINIFGVDIAQLIEHSDDIAETIRSKRDIAKFKADTIQQHTELTEQIHALKLEKTEAESAYVDIANALEQENAALIEVSAAVSAESLKLTELKKEASETSTVLTQTKNNITQLNETVVTNNKAISKLNSELKKLASDKSLISDEYGPYVKEGRSQAMIYVFVVIFPLLAIIFSVYELYAGASKILTTDYKTATDILASFTLRIPFAAVFGLAIYYSWKLTSSIILKIFTIHSDRLTLAKLLVLAREAVHSSARNLDLSNETILQEQLRLKIEVLKSHLSKDLGTNFDYNPVQTKKQQKPTEAVNDKNINTKEKTEEEST